MEATGLAVDLFGGGSIAGRNISTGIWGGRFTPKILASTLTTTLDDLP